ncbi:HAMP domain-containing histidine kinase [bacterium]|nr:HAMP domain-containing histidine kinase [candidate division CSSED10-310 bacterium]
MQENIHVPGGVKQTDSRSLGVLAHEIKSPISTVIQLLYAAELLLQGPGTEEALSLIRRAIKRAESALALARGMLDCTRIDQTRVSSAPDTVTPSEDLPNLLESHTQNAAGKGITIICDLQATDCVLTIQPFAWQIVVNNLVTNAIRYSKRNQGPQRVWVRTYLESDMFILEVRDEGIGMTQSDQQKVFEHFFRAVEAKEQTISGSGFGLAMVKMILDEIGGDIRCRSEYGIGTTFQVTIPVSQPSGARE